MTEFDGTKVKAGDRVWLGRVSYPPNRIRTVHKVTNTQVVIDQNGNGQYLVRYKRDGGWRIGGGYMADHIRAIATPKECAAWDAKQANELAEENCKREAEEKLEAERSALQALFPDRAWVSSESDGSWTVTIHGMTEGDVRKLATSGLA